MNQRMRLILLYHVTALALSCSVSMDNRNNPILPSTVQHEQTSRMSNSQAFDMQQLRGFYFGNSENKAGRLAWFIYLDPEEDSGGLYLPPRIIKLSHLVISPEGHFSFHINFNKDEVIDTFDGHLTSTGFSGYFKYSNGNTYDVTLNKLNYKLASYSESDGISGLYSDMRYSKQTGDLAGTELLLVHSDSGLVGAFTRYEGVPSESYALIDAALIGNILQFKIQTDQGQKMYHGSLSSKGIKLKSEDLNKAITSQKMILPKRMDIFRLMKSANTSDTTLETK